MALNWNVPVVDQNDPRKCYLHLHQQWVEITIVRHQPAVIAAAEAMAEEYNLSSLLTPYRLILIEMIFILKGRLSF